MNGIFDYLVWRGDVDLGYSPFNEIDAMILARLSYLPFEGVVGEDFKKPVLLRDAADKLLKKDNFALQVRMPQDVEFLQKLMDSRRFSEIKLCGYVDRFDPIEEKQFSAVCCRLPDFTVAAFRGTDGTLVGWKEDFNMAFSSPVPAQLSAAEYLDALIGDISGEIRTCGHSKGGNLAVYAAAFCKKPRRISNIYNYDGPGFVSEILEQPCVTDAIHKLHNFLPQTSIIGMLLDHGGSFTVVQSGNTGIMQHDLYSWEVYGNSFVTLETVTSASRIIDNTVTQWLANLSNEERERFVDAMFSVIMETGAHRLSDITDNLPRSLKLMYSSFKELDSETAKLMERFIGELVKTAGHNLKSGLFKTGADDAGIDAAETADISTGN